MCWKNIKDILRGVILRIYVEKFGFTSLCLSNSPRDQKLVFCLFVVFFFIGFVFPVVAIKTRAWSTLSPDCALVWLIPGLGERQLLVQMCRGDAVKVSFWIAIWRREISTSQSLIAAKRKANTFICVELCVFCAVTSWLLLMSVSGAAALQPSDCQGVGALAGLREGGAALSSWKTTACTSGQWPGSAPSALSPSDSPHLALTFSSAPPLRTACTVALGCRCSTGRVASK